MAQTPNTTSLGLNQWGPEDDIRTAQFTEDNRIVNTDIEQLKNEKVDKGNPLSIPLPLESGKSPYADNSPSHYYKNDNGLVTIVMNIKHIDGSVFVNNEILFIMPPGFRPPYYLGCPAILLDSGASRMQIGLLNISTGGTVSIFIASNQDGTIMRTVQAMAHYYTT